MRVSRVLRDDPVSAEVRPGGRGRGAGPRAGQSQGVNVSTTTSPSSAFSTDVQAADLVISIVYHLDTTAYLSLESLDAVQPACELARGELARVGPLELLDEPSEGGKVLLNLSLRSPE